MLEIRNDKPIATPVPQEKQAVQLLKSGDEAEVLDFLSAHPLLTFVMTGWVKDNGLESDLNRGKFYGSRDALGMLNGVALIGHATMFETNSEAALSAFASLARNCPDVFLVIGQEQRVERFMTYYSTRQSRQSSRELLFEQRSRFSCDSVVPNLRRATLDEVDLIVPVHAQMAFEQSGVNPLEADEVGFRERCARRVQQGRVWVCIENGQLIFKADVISDLSEVNYLEGIYVRPESRGQGVGSACLRQLTNILLSQTKSVCLLAGEEESAAHACYLKAGFRLREFYQSLFAQQESAETEN